MKITKIRFENIHSLKGTHEIDFAEGILGEAGLFAITGPTGSGKSTLLDIITLAIYNRIARVEKFITKTVLEEDGGIMTRNMQHCFAEVEYRVNGKTYRSHWSIERNKNNNLNNRKQELVEIASGTILESGTKTPEKNESIIGLSYEQFVKAMVLSQGEFSKLLQAPRNERNKLLEDITGARSYREIGKAVFQRYMHIKNQVKLKEAGLESIEVLASETVKVKIEELKVLNTSKPEVEAAYQYANEKIITRKELLKKLEEREELNNNKKILTDHLERFKENKEKLERHEKFSKYTQDLRDYDSILKEVENHKLQIVTLQKQKAEEESRLKANVKSSSELVHELLDITNANERLAQFRSKITNIQAQENIKQNEANLIFNQILGYVKNINQFGYSLQQPKNPSQFKPELKSLREIIQKSISDSGLETINHLTSKLESLRKSNDVAVDFLSKKQGFIKLQKDLQMSKKNLKIGEENIAKDLKTINLLEKETAALEKEIATQVSILEHQRKHQSLEDHRAQLKIHNPCPLCGSLEHPYAVEQPFFDVKEEVLKENQKLLKTKSELEIGHRQKVKFQLEVNERVKSEIEVLTFEYGQHINTLQELSQQLSWNYEENLEVLQTKRVQLNSQIQALEKSKQAFQARTYLGDLEKSTLQWEQTLNKYQSLKEERIKLYSGNNIDRETSDLSAKITQSTVRISSLNSQFNETQAKLNLSESGKATKVAFLDTIVNNEGLENIALLKSFILSEEIATSFRKKDAQLKDGATRLSEKEKTLTKDLNELRKKDDNTITMESLTNSFELAKKKWSELSENIGKITEILKKDSEIRAKQQQFLKELKALKKDQSLWKTMNDLIGDATGNKFSNFVQDLTLEQLIGFANKRLTEFSDRYLLDIPTAAEADKSDTLKVFDKYMGNARRSVKTLSGGETFLVSLAMAFALSDIASRNVKIESLFIDEGFGTLDPETLDQAITILEKMQNEGDKSVGVISHVSALKERITTQIKLEKSSLGYSTINVVQ